VVLKWNVKHRTYEDRFLCGVFYINEHARLHKKTSEFNYVYIRSTIETVKRCILCPQHIGHELDNQTVITPATCSRWFLARGFFYMKMEAIRSSETSVHTRTTWRHIPEDSILQLLLGFP
jgi:hypothetical protein